MRRRERERERERESYDFRQQTKCEREVSYLHYAQSEIRKDRGEVKETFSMQIV